MPGNEHHYAIDLSNYLHGQNESTCNKHTLLPPPLHFHFLPLSLSITCQGTCVCVRACVHCTIENFTNYTKVCVCVYCVCIQAFYSTFFTILQLSKFNKFLIVKYIEIFLILLVTSAHTMVQCSIMPLHIHV